MFDNYTNVIDGFKDEAMCTEKGRPSPAICFTYTGEREKVIGNIFSCEREME